jgi:CHRD domain
MSRTSVVTSAQVNAMKKGDAYVNVHTVKNAAGEIRGQIRG